MSVSTDYSRWMENLPENVRNEVPLHNLAIPGSHDSGTYKLRTDFAASPDAPGALTRWLRYPMVSRVVKCFMRRWSKCQRVSISDQLGAGVRYFDLRVAYKRRLQSPSDTISTEDFHLVHSLYGPRVSDVVDEVKNFLKEHPREVVLMDLNHFYMNQEDRHMQGEIHTSLIQYLGHQFSDVLRPAPGPGEQIPTLNELSEGNQQVIVIYRSGTRDDKIINGSSLQNKIKENKLWPGTWIESPWANTMDVTHCLGELEASAKNREGSIFHVFQAVLTPDADYIGPNCRCKCCGSVEADCADVINPQLMEWIKKDALKGSRGMIYITDFVDKPEDFVASVVSLNGQAK